MEIFKGYIKSMGKKPMEKVKGNEKFYTYNGIRLMDCDYGGVLEDNIIMVDIDDGDEAKLMLKIVEGEGINCPVLKTTRGYHFYFINNTEKVKNNKIAVKCALGITCDYKLGNKNTVVPLKVEGELRRFVKKIEIIDRLPFWLIPMNRAKDLASSETRNDDFYRYILPLQGAGYTVSEIREIVRLINKYILKQPLGEKELEVILRNEAFTKPAFFGDKGEFLHEAFAKWLIREKHIIKINSNLHIYRNNEYVPASSYLNREMIDEIPTLKLSQRREVMTYISDYIVENTPQAHSKYINLENGILDIETGEMIDHSPEILITNKIPVKYREGAYYDVLDKTLDKIACGDKDLRMLIEEMVGYCMLRRNELGKFFILTGDGGGGKSTFLDMLRKLLGEDNVSSVSLQEFSDKFEKTAIVGKLANIGDDISDLPIDDNSVLKKLVTGEVVQFQYKGQNTFDFKNYAKLLFASNVLPKFKDISDGLMRRLIIVPFKARFVRGDDYDPYIADKLMRVESMEYLLKLGIEGLKRVLSGKGFTSCSMVVEEMKGYEEYNNSVVGFVTEGGKFENENVDDAYRRYSVWCCENGIRPLSKNKVSRELKNKYGISSKLVRIGDKVIRLYGKG